MTVIVDVPELPAETVALVALNVKLPLAAPTETDALPVDGANVESPEYVTVMTCVPVVLDENVYLAEPLDNAKVEVSVVPSTNTVSVPVGILVTELEPEVTVIVIASPEPADGEADEADKSVRDAVSEDTVVVGQAVSRL